MSAIGGETSLPPSKAASATGQRALQRDSRSDLERLGRVLVPAMDGQAQIPLAQMARPKLRSGPAMLRDENGMLSGYVYVDVAGRDIGSYVRKPSGWCAKRRTARRDTPRLERPIRGHGSACASG